jgi:alanyl-tRNA synthetase
LEIPDADSETLRALGDDFREKYPKGGAAILASGATLIAVVTPDLTKRGLTAAALIGAIGGKGGGRPGMAQGSLPEGSDVSASLAKAADALQSLLS